jgi:hypothetical protein
MSYAAFGARIAFVIDNRVVQVMETDERLGAILLSNPIIVDVTGVSPEIVHDQNWNVDTQSFDTPSVFKSPLDADNT